ncbi:MAG: ATP-binding cassette domain-containing protein [Anaerolineae bacterium]|nr:ATP-binding cassette domain-containing protein [Anaerolineae bacterium]
MVSLHEITFAYQHQTAIFERFSWHAGRGDVWAVLGPSGCGKSTLLLLLAGLLSPQEGSVSIGGSVLTRPRPTTALVLQDYGLLPWATLRDNVGLGLRIRRFYGPDGRHAPPDSQLSTSTAHVKVNRWLQRLGIDDVADQLPGEVSGGQRQRAAIARAFVLQPDLLLMDEPFAALDAPTRESLQALTLNLCVERNLTVVLVTHSIEEAAFVGQSILLLTDPPNRCARVTTNYHTADAAYRQSATYRGVCATLREGLGDRRSIQPAEATVPRETGSDEEGNLTCV